MKKGEKYFYTWKTNILSIMNAIMSWEIIKCKFQYLKVEKEKKAWIVTISY
jgi:hypothetical protein